MSRVWCRLHTKRAVPVPVITVATIVMSVLSLAFSIRTLIQSGRMRKRLDRLTHAGGEMSYDPMGPMSRTQGWFVIFLLAAILGALLSHR